LVFKEKRTNAGVSMSSEISGSMSGQNSGKTQAPPETRQLRRKALKTLVQQLESIMGAEQRYMENIPENLQNSRMYESAEQSVSALEEALCILAEVY
jgi:hypothetical protein